MNLNLNDETKQTVIETFKIEDIYDEALDRASWNGTDYGPPSFGFSWCKGKEKLPG